MSTSIQVTFEIPGKPGVFVCRDCKQERNRAEYNQGKDYAFGIRQPCKLCLSGSTKKNLSGFTKAELQAEVADRVERYGCDALEALHQLATMKRTKDARMMQIKYLAADRLAPASGMGGVVGGVDGMMQRLNEAYQATAPRIREVRERIITFSDGPIASDAGALVVSASQPQD